MNNKVNPTDETLSLAYGLTIVTFGPEAVDGVLADPKWAAKYPQLIAQVQSIDIRAQSVAVLPAEVIIEIADRDDTRDVYFADPDGRQLYAVAWDRLEQSEAESRGHTRIPTREALLTYGAYCLFQASDKGVGLMGERGPYQDTSE